MNLEQKEYYCNLGGGLGGVTGKIIYYLFPEDFLSGCPRYINPDKTENLSIGIWFFSYVFFLIWVCYMTNRKKGVPSWYPKRLNLKGDGAGFTYSLIIGTTPIMAYLSMWVASFLRRILMLVDCW